MSDRRFSVRLFNTVEPVTTFYRDLIPYWEQLGWQVTVVMSRAEYRGGRSRSWLSERTRLQQSPSFGLKARSRPAKLVIMIAYMLYAALVSLFGRPVNRNVFLTQPPLFFVWGLVLQRLRRQPYAIVLMDLYPDVAVAGGVLNVQAPWTRVLLWLSRLGLRHADDVIVIGRCMRQRLLELGVVAERIHAIANWTDEEAVVPVPREKNVLRKEEGWTDKFVVLYSGNIGVSHYFDDILEVARRFRDRDNVLFVFIGHGARRVEITAFRDQHALQNIITLPFQPQEQLAHSLSAGDLHFVSLRPAFTGLVVPSKVYGVLAAGRSFLYQGAAHGEMAQLIAEQQAAGRSIGQVVAIGDVDALEAAVQVRVADKALIIAEGANARLLASSVYSKMQACRKYTAVLAGHNVTGAASLPVDHSVAVER